MQPAREDDLVDDVRSVGDERFDVLVAAKPLAELVVGYFQRIAKRLHGPDVAAQRFLERAAVDQRSGQWLGVH